MKPNTEAIVRMAWSRQLGLPDDTFGAFDDGRLTMITSDASAVTFVRLFDLSVLVGPQSAVEAAREHDDDELATVRTMLLVAGRGARALGKATLAYTDDYVLGETPSEVFRADPGSLAELARYCPPDDIGEAGLAEMETRFVYVDRGKKVVAASGYQIWGGILAHLGALSARDHRAKGLGTAVAGVAVNDALDAGLVPQWRASVDNPASRRLAAKLGFTEVGSQTTVLV